jgi:CBS domain-containing protein
MANATMHVEAVSTGAPLIGGALQPLAALRPRVAAADAIDELVAAAVAVPRAAATIAPEVAGIAALTQAISALNDEVTVRAVHLVAGEMGLDLDEACWLEFGSQARSEQTLITDQDNGLVFAARDAADADAKRARWMAFGQRVNEVLARCGYPLCEGQVMAGQPLCCLSTHEWLRRFEHWMAHGDANALFAARIYFDLRVLVGRGELAQPLLALLRSPAAAVPRFIKQMADVVLMKPVPLGWLGQVRTSERQGRATFDLKTHGTALFVDAARLWALALRLNEVGTVARLRAAAAALRVPASEAGQWVAGFEALQRLRLHAQRTRLDLADPAQRTLVPWDEFGIDERRELKQALRAARVLRQRIELDYCR